MLLTNVSPEQLAALRNNFENNIIISEGEEKGKYDVSIILETEMDYWKLFFSGADYTLNKLDKIRPASIIYS